MFVVDLTVLVSLERENAIVFVVKRIVVTVEHVLVISGVGRVQDPSRILEH